MYTRPSSHFNKHGLRQILRYWQTRTHCCGHSVADSSVSPFARARNICRGHKFCVRDTKNVSDFVQKHFVSATNVSQFAQPKKHHEQQCVRNKVSSIASTFTRDLSHFNKHVLSKNTLLQKAKLICLYTLQNMVLELSGSAK